MIVTILKSTGSFSALRYNQNKVSEGSAHIMEMNNLGWIENAEKFSTDDLVSFFEEYTARNPNIKNGQFHVAFSCKGDEKTHEQILKYAHEYLKEMGYAEEGQPMIAFAHSDTENNHVHVVTSRIAPDGHKINHSHERRRSQQVIEKLEKLNSGLQIEEDIIKAKSYSFQSENQFGAIMNSMGYKSYIDKERDTISFQKGASPWKKIPMSEIRNLVNISKPEKKERMRLRAILFKFRDFSTNKEELKNTLHAKMGMDIQFFGRKDNPYGYLIIDHSNQKVYKGGSIMRLEELLQFKTMDEHMDAADAYIDKILEEDPRITTSGLNKQLRLNRACVKNYKLHYGENSRDLKPYVVDALKLNNKIALVNKFKPCSEAQANILANFYKIDRNYININHGNKPSLDDERLTALETIINNTSFDKVNDNLIRFGFFTRKSKGEYHIIDINSLCIYTLDRNIPLDNEMYEKLELIDKINRASKYHVSSEKEAAALSIMLKLDQKYIKVNDTVKPGIDEATIDMILEKLDETPMEDLQETLYQLGFIVRKNDKDYYLVDVKNSHINLLNLENPKEKDICDRYDIARKIKWANELKPTTETEAKALARMVKIDAKYVKYDETNKVSLNAEKISLISDLINKSDYNYWELESNLSSERINFRKIDGNYFVIDKKEKQIYTLNLENVDEKYICDRYDYINKVKWVNQFKPSNEFECNILSKMFDIPEYLIKVDNDPTLSIDPERKDLFKSIIDSSEANDIKGKLSDQGFFLRKENDEYYIIDFNKQCIYMLNPEKTTDKAIIERLEELNPYKVDWQKPVPESRTRRFYNRGDENIPHGLKKDWEIDIDSGMDESDGRKSHKL